MVVELEIVVDDGMISVVRFYVMFQGSCSLLWSRFNIVDRHCGYCYITMGLAWSSGTQPAQW